MTVYPTRHEADAAVITRRMLERLRNQPMSDVHAVHDPDADGWVIAPMPPDDPRIVLRDRIAVLNPWVISTGIDPVAGPRGECDTGAIECTAASVEVSWSLRASDDGPDSGHARVCAGCAVDFVLWVLGVPDLDHITVVVCRPASQAVAA